MLASVGVALPLSYLLNIRFDEAFTLNTTSQDLVYAFRQAIHFEQQAPLYFVLLTIWRAIDPSIFFARLFSVVCLPLFVWVAAEAAKRYLKGTNPLFVAAIAAVHQQALWNALDIRAYAMTALLSAILLVLFHDGYMADRQRSRSRILFTVVAVISLYTQYYLGFQLAAGAVALIATKRWRPLKRYVTDMAIAGLLFLPMLVVIKGQVADVNSQIDAPLPLSEMTKAIYQRLVSLSISMEWLQLEFLKRWAIRAVAAGVFLLFAVKLIRRRLPEDVALASFIGVMTLLFFITFAIVGAQGMQPRHMSSLILPLTMLPFAAFAFFKDPKIRIGWCVLVVVLNIVAMAAAYAPFAKPGDFKRVAEYVMANEQPDQPVLVFHADAVLPLRHYYHGMNTLIALPQENGFEEWNPRNNVLRDEAQVLDRINSQPGDPTGFWLVSDGWCAHGTLSFNCDVLESVVDKYFVVESTQNFLEPTTVRLLRRK